MKVLCQVVDEVFKTRPRAVEDAKTMKEAKYYLVGAVIKELGGKPDLNIKAIIDMVNHKLEGKTK